MINNFGKDAVVQIPTVFEPVDHVASRRVEEFSETLPFRHLPNDIFWSLQFRKCIGYEGHLSFENVQNLMFKIVHKNGEKFFCF